MSAGERGGTPLPNATLDSIRRTKLALKGPLTTPSAGGYRSGNVALREEFELYANVRPVKSIVSGGRYRDADLVIVRENTEGMYVGFDRTFKVGTDPKALAQSMSVMTRDGCRRIVRYAFEYAKRHGRKKVTVVHKANILKATSGLFLETARMIAREYEGQIASDDKIVDNAAMQLVINPAQFDVIVTTNLFGDILSDEASGLVGGLGLAPQANIGAEASIVEAVHVPDPGADGLGGRGVADDHGAHGGAHLANHGADRGRGGDRGVVPPDLPDREEDRARMDTLKLLVTGCVLAGCAVPAAAQTSLSIYTDGRVVVRRSLPQPLEKGRNTLTLKLDGLDPTTLFSPDTGVGLVTAVLRPASERAPALESAVGQTLTFLRGQGDTLRATVGRGSPPPHRLSDGRFLLSEPGEPVVPAEVVRTAPEATVTLDAARARPRTQPPSAAGGA